MNGNFGGNKQGGGSWSQGGNKSGNNFNQGNKPFGPKSGGPGGPPRNQQRPNNMRGPQQDGGKPVQREVLLLFKSCSLYDY